MPFFLGFVIFKYLRTPSAASHHSVACPLDGKFNVMRTLSHASSRLPCSSDSMANDVTSAVATPHLFLAGQRTSAVAVGCSAPDTLDLYHECSRETSSGLFYLLVYLHRRYVEDYRIDFSRNYFLILFFSYFSIFQCRNNQVIYAEARGMTSKTKEPSTSS